MERLTLTIQMLTRENRCANIIPDREDCRERHTRVNKDTFQNYKKRNWLGI